MIIPATPSGDASHPPSSADRSLRLAVAQTIVPEDPTDPSVLRESGAQIRQLMRDAAAAGADLAQFPEGAITYPGKYVMSSAGPDTLAAADWSRINWDVMREEAEQVAALAGKLGMWTVFGSLHPLTFQAGGLTFGCALCIEVNFPEIFAAYEQMNVDCMLVSVMVEDAKTTR